MSNFSFQMQKITFSFYLVHFLFLLLIPSYSCRIILSTFGCDGLNEMSESSGCSLGDILNLTGPEFGQDFSKDLSDILNISTEIINMQNTSTIEEPKSRHNVSSVKITRKVSDLLSVKVFQENNGTTEPLRNLFNEKELIKNSDFEENLNGWHCYHCLLHRVPEGYQSRYAAKITNT